MPQIDWAFLQTSLIAGLGYVLAKVVDAIKARWDEAREAKKNRATREDILNRRLYNWIEHAYAVRRIAIEHGVDPDQLPRKPDE